MSHNPLAEEIPSDLILGLLVVNVEESFRLSGADTRAPELSHGLEPNTWADIILSSHNLVHLYEISSNSPGLQCGPS